MRARVIALALLLHLSAPPGGEAGTLCRWTGLCVYLSPGFQLTVVDAETGAPLSGVYAWAEWVQYGAHGIGGPLMVQDATSGADGRLTFPRWGPILGSRAGLVRGTDPALVVFRPGYATRLVDNGVLPGASEDQAVRGSSRDGETLRLERFRGVPGEWVGQLRTLAYPALSSGISDAQRDRLRAAYLRRIQVVAAELATLPPSLAEAARLRSALERSRRLFEREQR